MKPITVGFSPVDMWEEFLALDEFKDTASMVIPSALEIGSRRDVLVVTGANASGKSLSFLVISQLARGLAKSEKFGLEIMDIGMGRRTRSGIERAFMFGDEDMDSTGNISIKVVQTAVSTSRGRQGFHYVMLDEPDIGVGEEYHSALGEFLAGFSNPLPETCLGFVVATHSRVIARKLLEAGASSLRLGEGAVPMREWIANGTADKSMEELLALKDISHERFKAVSAMLRG